MYQDNGPLFSVIVPVYKVEKYLNQCVDSILAQTFRNFELILVDDGSPDDCGAICDEYARKDSRVKVIHKGNGGIVSARQAGYRISKGKYICNVDSDDYIAPELLAMAEEKIRDSCVDAVLFGYVRFGENCEILRPQPVAAGLYDAERIDTIRAYVFSGPDFGAGLHNMMWSLIMRRERFEPYLMAVPETFRRGEDLAAVAPGLAHCGAVYVLGECLYFYRNTPGSIVNTRKGDELDQALILTEYLREKMGAVYDGKLDAFVLRSCADHFNHYRENFWEYRRETLKMRHFRFRSGFCSKANGKDTGFFDRVVFFLLRYRMYNLLWLLWWIRRYLL